MYLLNTKYTSGPVLAVNKAKMKSLSSGSSQFGEENRSVNEKIWMSKLQCWIGVLSTGPCRVVYEEQNEQIFLEIL